MREIALIPFPRRLVRKTGEFRLLPGCRLAAASPEAEEAAMLLAEYLRPATGFPLPVVMSPAQTGDISLEEHGDFQTDEDGFCRESYRIAVSSCNIQMYAENRNGLCRAIQTLRQLLPAEIYGSVPVPGMVWDVPALELEDSPEYRWRGLHLDVGRYFFPEYEICRYIELLAQHKFNLFHWHLTDDQGWRLEIRRYPRLTEVGAWRNETMIGHDGHDNDRPCRYDGIPHGGFYSQEAVRRIVAFAAQRGVTVMPEIDMPGHVQAAVATYPELGNYPCAPVKVAARWGVSSHVLNAEPATFAFMKNVLSEVLELFPSKYIHVGGDEACRKEWEDNPLIRLRMQELNCPDFDALQGVFTREMSEYLTAEGRSLIGWDEIIRCGLPPGAAVMKAGRIVPEQSGFKMVSADNTRTYLDYYQSNPAVEPLAFGGWLPCELAYDFHPAPPALDATQRRWILGGQGQVWTEYMPDFRQVEYMAWPRACALGEKLWCADERCDFTDFRRRLTLHRRRLDAQQVNAHPLP